MDSFVQRAEKIRNGSVDPSVDNMLKICHDAKLVSTDVRMLDPTADPDTNGKLYKCAEKVFEIWNKTKENRGTQVVFSDIGVPNGNKSFNVYQFIKNELIQKGVPDYEICFVHDAKMIRSDRICSRMFVVGQNASFWIHRKTWYRN